MLALDPGLTAGERIARAVLDDVVSAYFSRLAVKELVADDRQAASFRQADAKRRAIKKAAEASFVATWDGNAPYGWKVGFYAALSLYTHPQSLPEEFGTDEETDAPVLSTDRMYRSS